MLDKRFTRNLIRGGSPLAAGMPASVGIHDPPWNEESGQMTLELAFCIPLIIVCALILINLCYFIMLTARFDRVSMDMAVAHGTSPSGEQVSLNAKNEVEEAIRNAMDADNVDVSVRIERMGMDDGGFFAVIAPNKVRFVCRMEYRPIPSNFGIAFAQMKTPALLFHERSIVLDVGSIGLSAGGD